MKNGFSTEPTVLQYCYMAICFAANLYIDWQPSGWERSSKTFCTDIAHSWLAHPQLILHCYSYAWWTHIKAELIQKIRECFSGGRTSTRGTGRVVNISGHFCTHTNTLHGAGFVCVTHHDALALQTEMIHNVEGW